MLTHPSLLPAPVVFLTVLLVKLLRMSLCASVELGMSAGLSLAWFHLGWLLLRPKSLLSYAPWSLPLAPLPLPLFLIGICGGTLWLFICPLYAVAFSRPRLIRGLGRSAGGSVTFSFCLVILMPSLYFMRSSPGSRMASCSLSLPSWPCPPWCRLSSPMGVSDPWRLVT